MAAWLAVAVAGLLLYPGQLPGGDEDEDPPYMIYIDPETGKYTTEDPDSGSSARGIVPPQPAPDIERSALPVRALTIGALVILIIFGLLKQQRRSVM